MSVVAEKRTNWPLAAISELSDHGPVSGKRTSARVPTTSVVLATRLVMGAAVTLAVLGVAVVILLPSSGYRVADVVLGVLYLTVPAVGALILRAQSRNAAGWVLLLGGTGFLVKNTLNAYADSAFAQHTHLPGAVWAAWFSQLGSIGGLAVSSIAVLLFPDGHLPTPRWRQVWWLVGIVLGGLLVNQGAREFWHWDVANPTALPVIGDEVDAVNVVALLLAPVLLTLCAWALHRRVRSAVGSPYRAGLVVVSRCAWLGALAQWSCVFLASGGLTSLIYVAERTAVVVLAFAAWYAVLRYRLFDLRLALSRTLIYLSLSAVVAGTYVAFLALTEAVTDSKLATPLALVLAALIALPLRDALQRRVNRLVYGQSRDPYAALAAVGDQLSAVAEPEWRCRPPATP